MPHKIVKDLFDHVQTHFPVGTPEPVPITFGEMALDLRIVHSTENRNIRLCVCKKPSPHPRKEIWVCPDGTVTDATKQPRVIPDYGMIFDEPDLNIVTTNEFAVCIASQLVPLPQRA